MFRRGRRFQRGPLLVRWSGNDAQGARLGLAIAKRQVPTAVARNRIKRILRDEFRHHQDQLPSVDLVISVRRTGPEGIRDEDLRHALAALWPELIRRCVD